MTDRPIILREGPLVSARAGKKTHVCFPVLYRAGRRLPIRDAMPEGVGAETTWCQLAPGDRLWVKEEFCNLRDMRNPLATKFLYRADLLGGRPIIPGRGFRGDRYRVQNYDAKELPLDSSRYHLVVTDVRRFPCQDLTWEELAAEGQLRFASDSKGQAWDRLYGFTLPWGANFEVIGAWFEFKAGNLNGVPAAPHEKQRIENPRLAALLNPTPPSGEALDSLEEEGK